MSNPMKEAQKLAKGKFRYPRWYSKMLELEREGNHAEAKALARDAIDRQREREINQIRADRGLPPK